MVLLRYFLRIFKNRTILIYRKILKSLYQQNYFLPDILLHSIISWCLDHELIFLFHEVDVGSTLSDTTACKIKF